MSWDNKKPGGNEVKRLHLLTVVAIALALGLGVTASSSSASVHRNSGTSGAPVYGGNLVMARGDDNSDLLPPETSNNADIWVLQQIYETLAVTNTKGTGVVPLLATSWTTSNHGLTWTFAIRKGVTFQRSEERRVGK